MRNYFLPVMLTSLMSGCFTMAPKYERPEAPVEAAFPGAEGSTENAADVPWREFFTDPKLQEVIARALEHNRDLRLALLNVEKARAMYGVQRAELYPPVDVTGVGSRQQRSRDLIAPADDRMSESYSVNLGVAAWEIDLFGRIRSLKDQALQEFLASEQAGRGARISIIAETASAYLALAADLANRQLAESTMASQQDSYNLIKRQYDANLISEIDLRRAQTQVDAARLDVARYAERVAQSRNALNLLAGGTVPQELLPADLAAVQAVRELQPGLSSEVLLQRPDIMAAEHQLIGANAFIGAARAAFFPRIGLTASFGTASSDLSGLFGGGTDVWNFTPVITMPIFDARVWAAARVSEATQKIALANYENTIQKAFREVADTLVTRSAIGEQVAAQRSLVEAAEIIHRLASKRYEQGLDSYLGVLDAHRTLFRARQVLIGLELAQRANQVKTYAVLGGGGVVP